MPVHGHSYLILVARVLNKNYSQPKKKLGFRRYIAVDLLSHLVIVA